MIREANNLYKALVQQKRDGSLASYQEYEVRLEQFDLAVEYSVEYGYIEDDLDALLQARNFDRLETLLHEMAPDMTVESMMYDNYDIYIGHDEDGWYQTYDRDDPEPEDEEESVPLRKRKLSFPGILAILLVLIVFVHVGRAIKSGDFIEYWRPEVTVPFDLR